MKRKLLKLLINGINDEIGEFTQTSETFASLRDEIAENVYDSHKTEYEQLDAEKFDFYGKLDTRPGGDGIGDIFDDFFSRMHNSGVERNAELRLQSAKEELAQYTPGEEGYETAIRNRNIESANLSGKLDAKDAFDWAAKSREKTGEPVTFHDEDGLLGINWDNVFENPDKVWTEFKKQLPQTLAAIAQGPAGGAAGFVMQIPSRLFFWAQMHNEYMDFIYARLP